MGRLDAISPCTDTPPTDGLIFVDKLLRIAQCNSQAALLLHRSRDWLLGRELAQALPAEFCNELRIHCPLSRRVGTPAADLLLVYDPAPFGELVGSILLRAFRPENPQYCDEEAFPDGVQHVRYTVHEPPAEVFVTDGNGITLHASNSDQVYGMPEHALIGRSVAELEAEGLFSPSLTPLVQASGKPVTVLQETRTGRRLVCTSHPVFDSSGVISLIVTISRDVTGLYKLIHQLAEVERSTQRLVTTQSQDPGYAGIIVESAPMRKVVESLQRIATFDSTVLFLGESGTGKDTLARLLHNLSPRRLCPFVKVNCGAVPETLMESEFFGYASGAFTGAQRCGKKGLLELADTGTLFLDEVDSLPLHLQTKLLHVIQEREFLPVGSTRAMEVDVRFVAATNKDLEALVRQGAFREDLYYRLHVVPIEIPPLRERREEILPLVSFFLQRLYERYGVERRLDDSAVEVLTQHSWPGNVRELENLVERCLVTSCGPMITAQCIEQCLNRPTPEPSTEPGKGEGAGRAESKLADKVAELEKAILMETLQRCGSTRKAADQLGVNQSTVVRKMKRFGVSFLN